MPRNEEYCDRCAPKLIRAMGFIPMPEMSSELISKGGEEDRRILVCSDHYFEAKANCFYVVPFDRDDDPVDNFITLVKLKHKSIRGTPRLKFGNRGPSGVTDVIDDIVGSDSRRPEKSTVSSNGSRKRGSKIHYHSTNDETICGLPTASVESTEEIESLTCKNCIGLLSREEIERTPVLY